MTRPLAAVLLAATLLALPCRAETLHLRDGSRITGTIIHMDETHFHVMVGSGSYRPEIIRRDRLAVEAAPHPWIAAVTGLALPGAGQIYNGNPYRALFYIGLTLGAGALGYYGNKAVTREGEAAMPNTSAGLSMLVPWGLSIWDAWSEAQSASQNARYVIDYP